MIKNSLTRKPFATLVALCSYRYHARTAFTAGLARAVSAPSFVSQARPAVCTDCMDCSGSSAAGCSCPFVTNERRRGGAGSGGSGGGSGGKPKSARRASAPASAAVTTLRRDASSRRAPVTAPCRSAKRISKRARLLAAARCEAVVAGG